MKFPIAILGIALLFSQAAMAADTPAPQTKDLPFKIIPVIQAQYPTRMLNQGVSHGEARVALHIDSEGNLVDHLVVAYTNPAFGEEAARVVKRWKYQPATINGTAIDTIVEVSFNFEVNGVLYVQRFGLEHTEMEFLRGGFEYQACGLKNLDRIPVPVTIVSPTYPKEWGDKGIVGNVVVDFYIDEEGKVRMAAAPAGAHEMLAGIAVAAVNKWRFDPPTRKGKPVLVHARQVFDFRKNVAETDAAPATAK